MRYFPQYLYCYQLLVPGAFQADLFRLLVLYQFGGVYADISVSFLYPLEKIIDYSYDEFAAVKELYDYGIQQTFIASYASHPLLRRMIEGVVDMISRRDYGRTAIDITGPGSLKWSFNKFFSFHDNRAITAGSYVINGFKLKFLYHTIVHKEEGNFMSLREGNTKTPEMKKKFKGYHELMYRNGTKHYIKHWLDRTVFSSDPPLNRSCPVHLSL